MNKVCKQCGSGFEITDKDLDFYKRINVPLPTLCPDDRQRRRLAWRNERTLYKRKCSGSGNEIICMYPSDTPFPVYDHPYFFSDKWSALDYGREFDFDRPFFDQFYELLQVVPRMKNYSVGNENAEYGNYSSWNKDTYMLFESDNNRDSFYSENSFRCVNIVDCSYVRESELCYQCIDVIKGYNLRYSFNSANCVDSWFLKNCIGCKNCFGCINLHNKQCAFFNEQLNKQEYEEKVGSLNLTSLENIEKALKTFQDFSRKFPHKYMNGFQNEGCTGDYLNNSKDAIFCFDSTELRDCKHIFNSERIKNGYDIDTYGGVEGCELVYECQSVGRGAFNVVFGNNVYQNLNDVWYCDTCANASNLFGCISVMHNEYCILNKKYSKEEYFELKEKIINHMRAPASADEGRAPASADEGRTPVSADEGRVPASAGGGRKTGELGEFFPMKCSPFAYNETVAHEYYPRTKEEVLKEGLKWKDKDIKEYRKQSYIIPEKVEDIDVSICDEILACEETGKNFKIQKAEFAFYKKMNLPIPRLCPDVRHLKRLALRNPRELWTRKCEKCGIDIETTYSPERQEKILCEKCYLEEIY